MNFLKTRNKAESPHANSLFLMASAFIAHGGWYDDMNKEEQLRINTFAIARALELWAAGVPFKELKYGWDFE